MTLSTRVPRATADQLQRIAKADYRSISAEVRRLVEERINAHQQDGVA